MMPVIDSAVDTTSAYLASLPVSSLSSAAAHITNLKQGQYSWWQASYPKLDINSVKAQLDIQTNSISTVHYEPQSKKNSAALVSAASMIQQAQQALGLSLKDLAAIYGVSRQTLYNYKKGAEQPNSTNWQKLQLIHQQINHLATFLPASPGALAKRIADKEGQTLFTLLQQEKPDAQHLQALAVQLAEQMNKAAPETHHQITLNELTRHTG